MHFQKEMYMDSALAKNDVKKGMFKVFSTPSPIFVIKYTECA